MMKAWARARALLLGLGHVGTWNCHDTVSGRAVSTNAILVMVRSTNMCFVETEPERMEVSDAVGTDEFLRAPK
jgi:hypothetical protein